MHVNISKRVLKIFGWNKKIITEKREKTFNSFLSLIHEINAIKKRKNNGIKENTKALKYKDGVLISQSLKLIYLFLYYDRYFYELNTCKNAIQRKKSQKWSWQYIWGEANLIWGFIEWEVNKIYNI